MTVDDAIRVLSQVTYKPGWKISGRKVLGSSSYCLQLTITVEARDSLDPSLETRIFHDQQISGEILELADRNSLLHTVYQHIKRAEVHEIDEWLKFDGQHVRQPHSLPGRAESAFI